MNSQLGDGTVEQHSYALRDWLVLGSGAVAWAVAGLGLAALLGYALKVPLRHMIVPWLGFTFCGVVVVASIPSMNAAPYDLTRGPKRMAIGAGVFTMVLTADTFFTAVWLHLMLASEALPFLLIVVVPTLLVTTFGMNRVARYMIQDRIDSRELARRREPSAAASSLNVGAGGMHPATTSVIPLDVPHATGSESPSLSSSPSKPSVAAFGVKILTGAVFRWLIIGVGVITATAAFALRLSLNEVLVVLVLLECCAFVIAGLVSWMKRD